MSNDKAKIVIVGLSSVVIYQALTIRRQHKAINFGRNQFLKLHEMSMYVLGILERHEIEFTEFDLMAMSTLYEGQDA